MIKYKASNRYRFLTISLLVLFIVILFLSGTKLPFVFIFPNILILILILLFRHKENYLILSEEGLIEKSSFKTISLKWSEIEDCSVVVDEGVKILGFKKKGTKQSFILKTFMHGNDFYLSNQYSVDLSQIEGQIKQMMAKQKESSE
ncbi:MAG: hypothetical protein NE327_13765 [Lentisphaeraceae bacterium]|nr:hypothetical protein [Lentisphaeraceae bacterium]